MKSIFATATLALFFLFSPCLATETVELRPLIDEAIKNNPQLKAIIFETEVKVQESKAKGTWEDPMLEFEAMDFAKETTAMRTDQVTITQKIPFPGKLWNLQSASEREAVAKRHEAAASRLEVIRSVKTAFNEWLLAHKKYQLLLERQAVLRQIVSSLRTRYSIGKASQAELLSLQVEEANLLSELLGAEKDIEIKAASLAFTLGRPNNNLREALPASVAAGKALPVLDPKVLFERASQHNPALLGAQAMRDASDSRHTLSRWNYLPDIQLKYRYTLRNKYQPEMPDSTSAGIGITIPLWFLFKQNPEGRAASADLAKSEALVSHQQNDLSRSLSSLTAEINQAQKRVSLLESGIIPLAKQAVTTGQSAYLSGKMEYAALLNTLNSRFQTELNYYEALTERNSKLAELEVLLGESLDLTQE